MFDFEKVSCLWWIIALIPLSGVLTGYFRYRNKAVEKFGNPELMKKLIPDFSEQKHKNHGIRMGIIGLMGILALANPQWGESNENVTRKGIDILIAMDISRSMWAEDVAPSRIQKAKLFVQRLSEKLGGSRLGLIVFAGDAYLETPLTADMGAFKLFLKSVSPDMLSEQGTAIDKAIETAIIAFDKQKSSSKVLLIISDGENHEGDADKMAAKAQSKGILVYTVGVGTTKGGNVPLVEMGRKVGVKTDENGEMVISKLNEEMLQTVAGEGGGSYLLLNNEIADSKKMLSAFDKIEKNEYQKVQLKNKKSWFPALVIPLFLILLWDSGLRPGRKNNKL
ncbi:MAG: VWA domain-containing protein [Bacteroidia bacterium]|nr:VWA domain-containing protein [Bacteroidia bacterium]